MGKGIFIIGTDTDVGKTFVTAGITYKLKESGYKVVPFKPIQSGGILDEHGTNLIAPDIRYIENICSIENKQTSQNHTMMNVYCLKEEVSPHLAANIENIKISKDKIISQYKKLINEYDYVVVEGAGGIVVPLVDNDYFVYNLIKDLDLEVLIVARAGVGTINHTVLTVEFLKSKNIKCKGIMINKYNGKFYEDDNIQTIENITGLSIVDVFSNIEKPTRDNIIKEYKDLSLERILNLFN